MDKALNPGEEGFDVEASGDETSSVETPKPPEFARFDKVPFTPRYVIQGNKKSKPIDFGETKIPAYEFTYIDKQHLLRKIERVGKRGFYHVVVMPSGWKPNK